VGRVNHCSLLCRLAKSRGLRRRGKYGAVIGQKTRFFVCAQCELPGYGFLFKPITTPYFHLLLKPRTEFPQTFESHSLGATTPFAHGGASSQGGGSSANAKDDATGADATPERPDARQG